MANPTTNFGWVMPTSASLVTNLPADFNTFGQAVDTSMAQLKGGTTGQILSKTSATDMAFTWITNDVGDITAVTAGTGISGGGTSGAVTITNSMATEIAAKGDLIAGTGAATFDNLTVGANATVLTADSTTATGLKWATASAGALTKIVTGTFTTAADTGSTFNSCFSSTYEFYLIEMSVKASGSANLYFQIRNGGTTRTSNYFGNSAWVGPSSSTLTNDGSNGTSQWLVMGISSAYESVASLTLDYRSTILPQISGTFNSIANNRSGFCGLLVDNGAYDGFILSASSGTITGTATVYGLAK
jgi:hypothetical protein